MQGHCSTCGVRLESQWKFCPLCGGASVREVEPKGEPEKTPAKGAFGGLLFGMLAIPILVIVGTMLCLTGLGAILGIPMILTAVFTPLLGPMIGLGALKGKCPWCGVSVSSVANTKDFDCHSCGRRIAIRHREFVAPA
jgi:predicted RNA-binding Zn-ribbon protein involved in translation (DUF1610 family)